MFSLRYCYSSHYRCCQTISMLSCNCRNGFFQFLTPELFSFMVHLYNKRVKFRLTQVLFSAAYNSTYRFFNIMHPRCLPFSFPVTNRNNKRLFILQYKFLDASCNAFLCIYRQRAHSTDTVFFFDFIRCVKNRRAWNRPVDNLRRSSPWLTFSVFYFFAVLRRMGAFRPDIGLPSHLAIRKNLFRMVGAP